MAAVFRPPLAPRTVAQVQSNIAQHPSGKSHQSVLKRPRSPETHSSVATHEVAPIKRHRTQSATTKENVDKQQRKMDRDARETVFREKYTSAFPSWTFYFDITDAERDSFAPRVLQLKGRIAKFFSNEVTHFITNRPVPENPDVEGNKENKAKSGPNLRSPIKLKGLPDDIASSGYETLVRKAKQFGMKIWSTPKLNSVLERCSVPASEKTAAPGVSRSLTSLLETEKRFGTTTERDPTQKRHDFHYFSKGSYFVLVEDMRQELATIAALEYPVTRTSDGKEKGSWPVPYCDPRARGPFIEYNEKEERRRERQDRLEREREEQRAVEAKKLKMRQLQRKQNDLRRSVSMSNLHRNLHEETYEAYPPVGDNGASGFNSVVSGDPASYIAASGNSVSIASTYGTTSTMGVGSSTRNNLTTTALPLSLRGRLHNQVVTSRRVTDKESVHSASVSKASASSAMMPPPEVPVRRTTLLRKCKSTSTLRLDKRDEKSKPGYCESCRQKFEDFKEHIRGRRHQKFANNNDNFVELDFVLKRVRRRTRQEAEEAEIAFQRDYGYLRECALRKVEPVDDDGLTTENDEKATIPMDDNDNEQYIYLDDD
ncbi:uncharacterized protein FOMMEDRAFT_141037 [Fomitiporia mediterranea MF3/22]|uniref:uncharacterized protein n=1 Tax=Fomitiporia mediterranea (strain MF3/22) TaxID=694068 RepID=UPI000440865A|nr:uncharacterized protein FOMMEDRAFT_141037 [Fomitiporia mediterranea MF3/22]EJD03451.1 hypothetical protein FOMMEDRAFT_141037 [Fomitiporia mediterranea MF3/22]